MKKANYTKSCEREFLRTFLLASLTLTLPAVLIALYADYYLSIIFDSQIVLHLCHLIKTVVPSTFNLIFLFTTLTIILLVPTGILRSLYHIIQGISFPAHIKPRMAELSHGNRPVQKRAGGYRVIEIDSLVPFALAGGVFDKRIIVSRTLKKVLTPDEYDAVLMHEAGHLKMNHPFKRVLLSSILRSLYVLPSRKETWEKFRYLTELAADEFAVTMGVRPAVLASAIVKVARQDQRLNTSLVTGFSDSQVTERVHALLELSGGRKLRGERKGGMGSRILKTAPIVILILFTMQPFFHLPDSAYCMNPREGMKHHQYRTSATISICTERDCTACTLCSPSHKKPHNTGS